MSPLFESLVVNNLTILTDEPDDSTAMVWNEAEVQTELENNEKAIYRLDLNDKEVLLEEIEDLMAYNKTQKLKDLRLDKNEFFDEGVELLVQAPALKKLLTLSLAYNKLTDQLVIDRIINDDFGILSLLTGNLNDVSFNKSILSKDRVKIIYSIPEFNYDGYIDILKSGEPKKMNIVYAKNQFIDIKITNFRFGGLSINTAIRPKPKEIINLYE